MTTPRHDRKLSRRQLRNTISAMVLDIETVMSNINIVLGEVRDLVQQIDTITEKLELNYENKVKNKELLLHLDKNSNVCDVMRSDKLVGRSENRARCSRLGAIEDITCILGYTYNDKYPKWIQSDNWKTQSSVSEISEISSGSESDVSSIMDDSSWRSVSSRDILDFDCGRQAYSEAQIQRLSKCCVDKSENKSAIEDAYCGVYESIMEEMLEYSGEVILSDRDIWDSSSVYGGRTSVSISDENFICYNKSQTMSLDS